MKKFIIDFVGLRKPYRFERTLAVLCSLLMGLVVGGSALYFWSGPGLTWGTPRAWYFIFVGTLLAIGILCAPWPRIAMVVLSLAALEIGFGLGSAALAGRGLFNGDLLPLNEGMHVEREWHPLQQAVRKPVGLHSSDKLRTTTVIAVFGGSTAEDVAVPDGEKWSQRLEALLGPERFSVINHGSLAYSTSQMVVQTAFYESASGIQPTCAVYYVGGIDVQFSYMPNLDPGYADYQAPSLIDALEVRRIGLRALSVSPTLSYLARLAVLAFDTARPANLPDREIRAEPDPALEAIFIRNVRTISAINRQRGIRSLWIGEVVPPSATKIDERDLRLQGLLSHLKETLQREVTALGDVYIPVAESAFAADDFADSVHFAAKGSQKFAAIIAPAIEATCR
jgi:lysophospholipase L1-like esterase